MLLNLNTLTDFHDYFGKMSTRVGSLRLNPD